MRERILIVDDEAGVRASLSGILSDEGYRVDAVETGEAGVKAVESNRYELALLDVWLPGIDGIETLTRIQAIDPDLPVVVISGHGTVETAVKAVRLGAADFIEKPLSLERILLAVSNSLRRRKLEQEVRALKAEVEYKHQIIGESEAVQELLRVIAQAAPSNGRVLITGENGTGKELIARMLHHAGTRSLKPFVAVNCGAIASTLLESELFGILPDTATGVKGRPGRFVEAEGGTLFLDEIGEMPVQQQVALLRVLSASAVTPVGGGRALPIDVRVIAATNRDLSRDIEDGRFRQDLWYRLNVIPIEIPPLRERRADIPALAQHFAAVFAGQQDREAPELSPALMNVLMQSDWAGNVRELQNYIERLMAMTPGKVLRPDPLPHDLQKRARAAGRPDRTRTLREMVAELERRQVQEALERHGGNQSQAARELGLTEQSLRYRLRRYALPAKRHFQRMR